MPAYKDMEPVVYEDGWWVIPYTDTRAKKFGELMAPELLELWPFEKIGFKKGHEQIGNPQCVSYWKNIKSEVEQILGM